MNRRIQSVLLAAFTLFSATAVLAQQHPAYLHALADLRYARAVLSQPSPNGINNDTQMAIAEIDKAINEVKKASIDDGKNLNDHPPIDAHLASTGRYHKALELLNQAHADVSKAEDLPNAQGLQGRIKQHIDAARQYVENAARH